MDTELIQRWIDDWGGLWELPDLSRSVRVRVSRRLRRSLGRCDPRDGSIRLHAGLFDSAGGDGTGELLREVVCHEVAHIAAHRLHGRRIKPHGPEWKRLMSLAGFDPRARLPVDSLPESFARSAQPRTLYDHSCPVCGAQRTALKRVPQWRCKACFDNGLAGRLEITTRPSGV